MTFTREPARRVFAQELRDSDLAFRESEEHFAPLFTITPTGAKCNRVLIVGTLTEKDNIGDDAEYWRARVTDPTGSILIYVGQYQPEAATVISEIEPPAFVSVIGKPSVFETEDGTKLISIRAEHVSVVDAKTRDRWIIETAERTLARIEAMEEFMASPEGIDGFVDGSKLAATYPPELGNAHQYYSPDMRRYRAMVTKALAPMAPKTPGGEDFEDEAVVIA